MDLWNLPLSRSSELFPSETVEKVMEKSSRDLQDEAIRKAVSTEKPARKSTKNLHFCQSTQLQQVAKCPSLPASRKSSRHPSASGLFSGSMASSSSSCRDKGKKF